jgi:hypothetical protein
VSAKLTADFGRGYGQRNLARMVQFAEVFPDPKILTSLMTKLGWTHFRRIIYLDDPLKRLVAMELKIGDFEAADKGQMELYLNWLKRHESEPDEAAPMGIILCAGKSAEHVELLEVEKSGIHVASYWTKTLPKDLLRKKLHQAVATARALLGERQSADQNPT